MSEIVLGDRPKLTSDQVNVIAPWLARSRWQRRKLLASKGVDCTRHMYKYFAVDPKSSASMRNIHLVLVRSMIWLSAPSSFNDPFDFQAYIELPSDPVKACKFLDRGARLVIPKNKGYKKERERQVRAAMRRFAANPDSINDSFRKARDSHGVCCFAEDPRNLLMWAHYGRSHTGVCVMFEVARDMEALCLAREVKYGKNFPRLVWPDDKDRVVEDVIFYKDEIWKYEKERRIVDVRGPNRALRLLPGCITGVIVGAACPSETEAAIDGLLTERLKLGSPAIPVYRATAKKDDFGITIRRR